MCKSVPILPLLPLINAGSSLFVIIFKGFMYLLCRNSKNGAVQVMLRLLLPSASRHPVEFECMHTLMLPAQTIGVRCADNLMHGP
jgi:hypothetical protein